MIQWEKEHHLKVKRIKRQVIERVDDADIILIIEGKNIAHIADLGELPSSDSQAGAIDIELRKAILLFINK